ncbi:MAG: glycosyltransferase [Candidatus Binatia bacterium]
MVGNAAAPESPANRPELSVVIAVISGGCDVLRGCLEALQASAVGCRVECIVPYDARLDGVAELAHRFPWVDFVDARAQVDAERFGSFSREHHDILRAIGLRRARGRIIAMLEDHGTASSDWCSALLAAHEGPDAAVGGAIENGVDRPLNWAVYYCDFGRYQNPVPQGPVASVSDSNVAYKRDALASVEELWREAFHETVVNGELQRRGAMLRLEPRMIVYQTRRDLRLWPALRERYVWGRSFAGSRVAQTTRARRGRFAGLALLLPAVLSWRVLSQGLRRGRHLDRLLLCMPLVVLLETWWSFGELVGYVTGRSAAPRRAG